MLRVFEIMEFKHVAELPLNFDDQTCGQQSTSYQTVLGFHNWLKEMFPHSICLGIIKNHDENAAVMISAVFVTHQPIDSWNVF